MFDVLKRAFKILKWREFRAAPGECAMCGKTIFIKLRNNERHGIRCLRCGASVTSMAFANVFKKQVYEWMDKEIYELSSRGPFFRFLQKNTSHLTYSEYFDDISCGAYKGSVQCQDVQSLTYSDCSFDVCTCTEVFEHVPDDLKGFREIYRVLRPGGIFLFTVPLSNNENTLDRAYIKDGKLVYLEEAQYHDDRIRGQGTILCYRNYGIDILNRLDQAGFRNNKILLEKTPALWGYDCKVIVAHKPIDF